MKKHLMVPFLFSCSGMVEYRRYCPFLYLYLTDHQSGLVLHQTHRHHVSACYFADL